mmetsp:Transcript_21675/g.60301  ORF Transcript_21675/g.60301 Transcript_21675/m.60301 type:complete len:338 (+) Transcript_21675:2-1015(+)
MCCAMCQGVVQCKAWTWVKDAGLDGCPSQCWLKGGLPTGKQSKPGLVSGLPPDRPSFLAVVASSAASASGDAAGAVAAEPLGGSMFCFSLMVPHSYEQELLEFQHKERISIFGCDAWDVYSNISLSVCPGVRTTVVPTDLTVKFGGDSYTALNSWIFIAVLHNFSSTEPYLFFEVWKRVIDDGRHKKHNWIAKVDPDAVFFPERLRPVAAAHAGVGYISNCKYGLHGPIEVFSKNAITAWAKGYKTCQAHFWNVCQGDCFWGEDLFIDQCLWKVLNVTRENDYRQLVEDHCDAPVKNWTDYTCEDATHAAFHPFKNKETYMKCLQAANAKTLEVPLQ